MIEQTYYDVRLEADDELGKELLEIVALEKKQNKNCQVIVHQVIQVDQQTYTVIVNIND